MQKDSLTCFCAAKITFIKFIYCNALSSAAFMTYIKRFTIVSLHNVTAFQLMENRQQKFLPKSLISFLDWLRIKKKRHA